MSVLCFDLDGTICTQRHLDYQKAKPIPEVIAKINQLHQKGHEIIIYTARGSETKFNWGDVTRKQLRNWGVHYDRLLFGKPNADYYVDDRGVSLDSLS